MNLQRITHDPGPYQDENINYWAERYTAHRVGEYGIHFDAFLQGPQQILDRIASGQMKRLEDIT